LALSSWQIEKLPFCSDGNIIAYYSELWRNLNYRQKDVLHLCSGFQFAWPRHAIGTVVKDNHDNAPSVDAVSHMLSEGGAGVRPFHESLVVFVRNQAEHNSRITSLLPDVCQWLSSSAPQHLKDNWLWSSMARAGNSTALREGVTREWVLDRLISGMPIRSCIRMLSEAETYAFKELEYAEAYSHRSLKTRLINGPEFQIWDTISLETLSLVMADDASLNEIISGQNEYAPRKLSTLAIALWYGGKADIAKLLSRKAIDRYQARTKLLSSQHYQDKEIEASVLIKAGVLTDCLNYDAIFESGNFSNWPNGYVASFRAACRIKKELDLLCRAWRCLPYDSDHIGLIEIDAIRLSIVESADITYRPEYGSFNSQNLSLFLNVISKKKFYRIDTYHFYDHQERTFEVENTDDYHSWFFASVSTRLNAEGDFCWLPVNAISDRIDVSSHYYLLNELADQVANELLNGSKLSFDLICSMFPSDAMLDEGKWEAQKANISLKRIWIEIAADCHLIATKSKISYDEFKNTIELDIFKLDSLRSWYVDIGIRLLDDKASELLIKREEDRQMNELEQTIENSNSYLQLAEIAFHHDKLDIFKNCIRKTWDFVLGYGHHKDRMIFDVLKAINYLSEVDSDSALEILERISPIVFNISEFTDGDETRHSKHSISSLLAKLNPKTAASIYEQELSDGEWYYAEETFQRLLERSDLSSTIVKSIYMTGVHSSCYQYIKDEVELGNLNAVHLADEIENQFGIQVKNISEIKYSSSDALDQKVSLQPSDYPPEDFEKLENALKGNYSTKEFWRAWYNYWCDQGQEYELLQQLNPRISKFTDKYSDKRYLLDLIFNSAKKINGKEKVFNLLIETHKAMGGWSDWYEREEDSINRLKMVSDNYSTKIDEFIELTTLQSEIWEDKLGNLIISGDRLVFLLSYSNRKSEALDLTLAMVESLEDSVRNLKLECPVWDWSRNDNIDEALVKSLISRLKLPIPSIKLWVMDQISSLLIAEHPNVEELLIDDLSKRKQESECVEVLCVFFIAKSQGYVCPNDLGLSIKARSTLSDLLLSELISNPEHFGNYAYPFFVTRHLEHDNNRFEHFQNSHVPRVYNSFLEKEELRTGLPLTLNYQLEWSSTYVYQPPKGVAIDYFFGSERQRATGQFYTQASHRGRSAYLRTIEASKKFYKMPENHANNLSIPALPIEPSYIGLMPKKPQWLPRWDSTKFPDKDNLISFVCEILERFDENNNSLDLLAVSLPIQINSNTWVDLTIIKGMSESKAIEEIEIKERHDYISFSNLLEKELFYESVDSLESDSFSLAATSYPLLRYGHFYSDLESRGLYIPKCNILGKEIIGSSFDGVFQYSIDSNEIGYSSFWYDNWKHIHPKGIRSVCGSYTVAYKHNIDTWVDKSNREYNSFYTCQAVVLTSEYDFKELDKEEIEFFVSCK